MIKAIETRYQGFRFRSRLEARWAVFFDALGIPWEYEKEGYDLDGELYLPDFWLPEQDCWIEIKGQGPFDGETRKAQLLSGATGKTAYIFFGQIPSEQDYLEQDMGHLCEGQFFAAGQVIEEYWNRETDAWVTRISNGELEPTGWDNWQMWCACPWCRRVGIEFSGWANRLCSCTAKHHGSNDWRHYGDTKRIKAAFTAARQARFEHGESGHDK